MQTILIFGASYGSLLAMKLIMAGHRVTLVCRDDEAALINGEGTEVRLTLRGDNEPTQFKSHDQPGILDARIPSEVDLERYSLVAFAMQEPQFSAPESRQLVDTVAAQGLPCLSIMNMPPLTYMRRILDEMGIGEVEAEIRGLRAAPGDPQAAERADRLEGARGRLIEETRDLVERNIALFADPASARLREEFLERMRLANIPPRDFDRVRRIVRRMAKRLAGRHARRRFNRRDGRLDPRRTIRSNIAHDGIPFRLTWRYTRIERPKVVAVCDVSGSVAAAARFLLLLLHSLREVMSDLRAFAFSSHLEDVDDLLAGRPIEEAAADIIERIGFRPTDYGRTLRDLEDGYRDVIDRKTTVLVLGDARNNRGNPETAVLERIFQRAKRVVWLNPEPRPFWGTGDSEMLRYLPYCHVARVCNTLRHLERAVDDLLATRP